MGIELQDKGDAAKIAELHAVCIGYRSFLAVVERQLGRSY
jgi:hypothetical protein